jgi:Flp pilus assembly protein TadG
VPCAQKGATAVEMALITPIFFLFLMGMTEVSLMLTAQQLMESATFNATRLAKTGYTATGKTQLQTITQVLNNELQGFGTLIDVSKLTMTYRSYNTFTQIGTGGSSGLGTAAQIVVYTVSYPWPLFTPMLKAIIGTNGVVTLNSQIVVRNEPYG